MKKSKPRISFYVGAKNRVFIGIIVARAVALDPHLDALTVEMDISACHANGCPLNLEFLASATDVNLMHDVWGIFVDLDRTTGKLRNFTPRYAQTPPELTA